MRNKERVGVNKKPFFILQYSYNALSKMRAHCSGIAKFLGYTIFDGASFWVINAKKRRLLAYTMLDKNALIKPSLVVHSN